MPQVPVGQNLGAYSQSPLAQAQPSQGNLLMAASIQSQDPARSMPEGPDRPRLPVRPIRRQARNALKTGNAR
jgi:hypothetical protein